MMKNIYKHLGSIILLLILLQSCKPNDIYHNLTDEARALLPFETGDTFKLKNTSTDEVITLTVTFKEIRHYEDGSNESSFFSFGPPANIYVEYGEYTFTDASNCYNGTVIIEGTREEDFEFTILLKDCFIEPSNVYEYYGELFPSIEIDGTTYANAYFLKSFSETLYYTKEKGIIQISDTFGNEPRFTIVE